MSRAVVWTLVVCPARTVCVCVCVDARMGRGDGRRTDEGVRVCVLASCVRS